MVLFSEEGFGAVQQAGRGRAVEVRGPGCTEFKVSEHPRERQLALQSGASESGRDGSVRVMGGSGH